ncbi:hypothetical protein ACFGZ9_02660 [Pasteurella multocida]
MSDIDKYRIVKLLMDDKYLQAIPHIEEIINKFKSDYHLDNQRMLMYAYLGGGLCYFNIFKQNKNKSKNKKKNKNYIKGKNKDNLDKAIRYLKDGLLLASTLVDEEQFQKTKINVQNLLAHCYLIGGKTYQENQDAYFNEFFELKKQRYSKIFNDDKNSELYSLIIDILSVLNITPAELGKTPLAHYTSANVLPLLFGLSDSQKLVKISSMRMNSATYMNDPSEGKSLLELLNQPELNLENKVDFSPTNAFFACFSSRVNDLNQFRLYGREDEVEASGCCLVFNKKGSWIKEPRIESAYQNMRNSSTLVSMESIAEEKLSPQELPLYQIAYITYQDDYITKDSRTCEKLTSANSQTFLVSLERFGKNVRFYNFRRKKLANALNQLIRYFSENNISDKDKKDALEYIRYLFKDFAFRDEKEFRLLKIADLSSDEIKICEKTQSIYIPYADISGMVDEVILGTNYEKISQNRKVEILRYRLKHNYPDIQVSQSTLPINANLPVKKTN